MNINTVNKFSIKKGKQFKKRIILKRKDAYCRFLILSEYLIPRFNGDGMMFSHVSVFYKAILNFQTQTTHFLLSLIFKCIGFYRCWSALCKR